MCDVRGEILWVNKVDFANLNDLGSDLVWGKDDEGFEGSVVANSMVGVSIGSEHAWGRTSRVLIS